MQRGGQVDDGRCKICGYKRPLSHHIFWKSDNIVNDVGSTCAAKIKAALNLRCCDKNDHDTLTACIDAAQRALTM